MSPCTGINAPANAAKASGNAGEEGPLLSRLLLMSASHPDDILIRDESIRLGQLLKLANLAEDGIQAKEFIEHGAVTVNDEVETRRGRQVRHGDVVELDGHVIRVVSEAPAN